MENKIDKFFLLMWKNFLLQWRHPIQTIVEIVTPVTFTILLVIFRSLVHPIEYPASFYLPFETAKDTEFLKTTITWSPTNPNLHKIMDETVRAMNSLTNRTFTHESVANYSALETKLTNDFNLWDLFAGVAFNDAYGSTEEIQSNLSVVLRFPSDKPWYTEYIFPIYYIPGIRTHERNTGGPPHYYDKGFLMLQQQLGFSIINFFKKSLHDAEFNRSSVPILMQRLSYPKFTKDLLLSVLDIYIGTVFMLSFVYTCINIVKVIVVEKEKQLKETMKIMGLSNWLHWAAWFCKSFCTIFISVIIMVILLTIKWYPDSEYTIFTHSDPILLCLILMLFTASTVTFSFAISSFVSKANVGAAVAGIAWFLFYCPFMTLQYNYDQISFGVKMFVSIFSNSAIGFVFRLMIKLENAGVGLQWNNVWSPIKGENILMGHIIVMLFVDAVLYFLIAIYFEAVLPGQYGIAKPWYFFLDIFNCCSKSYENVESKEPVNVRNHEKEPTHLNADIKIRNLYKIYGKNKIAVKDLSLNMYRNQITALLGQNGAGKSTTISILTGMISPSKGTANINGYDVRISIDNVRNSLGICPQHNILFDELTVEEHLYFYSKLKGVSKHDINKEIHKYLHLLDFTEKAKSPSSELSGGMKRKLSVGIALCGKSRVVLLDEPTAGMDPSARRSLWDLLLSQKKDRTILLTTHFMDEADLLGDRIAIMSNGSLQCSGSSFFLKKKYGAGYHLILEKLQQCNVEKITELLRKYIPNINIHSNIGSELTYVLNEQYLPVFEAMLNELEIQTFNLGICSYGISLSTLEEVFIKVSSDLDESEENAESSNGVNNHHFTDSLNSNEMTDNVQAPLLTSWALRSNQISAMFMKRRLSIMRGWILLLIQISIPIIFILLTFLIPVDTDASGQFPMIPFRLSRYVDPMTLITREINNTFSENYMTMLDSRNKRYINFENKNMSLKAIEEANKDISIYDFRYIAGASFLRNNSIIAWFSNQPYHGSPLALQLVLNTILHTEVSSDNNIVFFNHPLPLSSSLKFSKLYSSGNLGFQVSFNFGFSMIFVSACYVMFYIQERSSKFKHLQFVSGINVLPFWIPSFICDIVIALITYGGAVVIFLAFQVNGFNTFEELGRIFVLYISYIFGSLPLMYLVSFWQKVPSSGFVRISLINILLGTGGYIAIELFSSQSLELQHIADVLKWIFIFVPQYCFNSGLSSLNMISSTKELCDAFLQGCMLSSSMPSNICPIFTCRMYSDCCHEINFFSYESPGVGKNILFPCVIGIFFFTILFLIEYNIFDKFQCTLKRYQKYYSKSDELEDDDVSNERNLITYDVNVGNERNYNLVLHNVCKNYKKLVAVNNISLGVNAKECFGLLGVNGAGKTTTFRIITGDLKMSSGDVWVNGWNIKKDLKKVYRIIGYCPQFDALLEDLTCEETLIIFALLRGIRKEDCKQVATTLSRDFDFYKHLKKKVKELSGGNKRKLSTALALVGNPLVLYLDEPTAGVDVATKRYLWNALCKIRDRGTTIILTSHSMEECEALCTRLAIMVNGSFKCIGSTQHLKSKFSDGYTLTIKTKTFNSAGEQELALETIQSYVMQNFKTVQVREKHQEMISFYITNKNQLWSKMFGIIERGKSILPIEDYSLGQCSLEQVFLTFTKQQREDEVIS